MLGWRVIITIVLVLGVMVGLSPLMFNVIGLGWRGHHHCQPSAGSAGRVIIVLRWRGDCFHCYSCAGGDGAGRVIVVIMLRWRGHCCH